MTLEHPVIGKLRPYRDLDTGFDQFDWDGGIHGLAKVENAQLHLLSIHADKPGTGQFRHFMNECKAAYKSVRVWSVWSAHLRIILRRYGFTEGVDVDKFGAFHEVWDWET